MSKKLVIFDMDGTLVNSSLTIINAINFVRSNIGLAPLGDEEILQNINNPNVKSASFYYEADHFTPEHEEWFAEYYSKNHEKEIRLYKGINTLLTTLKQKGYKLAVATNAYKISTMESLKYLNIHNQFDVVICADEVSEAKPNPEMLYYILDRLKLSKDEAIFVGDGERDMVSAERAGIDYLMVNWGFSDYNDAIHNVERLQKIILEF